MLEFFNYDIIPLLTMTYDVTYLFFLSLHHHYHFHHHHHLLHLPYYAFKKRPKICIYPGLSYTEALMKSNLSKLHTRRNELTERLVQDNSHKLHLLPALNSCPRTLRNMRKFSITGCKTNRFQRSFIMFDAVTARY